MSTFLKLSEINVNDHTEKKGGFTYLSWPFAVAELRKADPKATWETIRFNGLPYCQTDCGFFVEVSVTVEGITLSQIHPVLDNRNKPILKPSAFDINTSIQRCMVKAIALHGLGLYIYAGEDLPLIEEPPFDHKAAVVKIAHVATLEELKTYWVEIQSTVATLPPYQRKELEMSKDAKKADLTI